MNPYYLCPDTRCPICFAPEESLAACPKCGYDSVCATDGCTNPDCNPAMRVGLSENHDNEEQTPMKTFKEYRDVPRPDWLGEAWDDTSWHNDALPHATLYLTPAEHEGAVFEIWVNYADESEREVPYRFLAVFQRDYDGASGADRQFYAGEDEAVAKRFARAAEIAKSIIADIVAKPIRRTATGKRFNLLACRSFSELHDGCDANVLGDLEKLLDEFGFSNPGDPITEESEARDQIARDAVVDILNDAQAIVDHWLSLQMKSKTGGRR